MEHPHGNYLLDTGTATAASGNLGKPVMVFTINGIRLTGKLWQFDHFTLLIEDQDGISSLVFKHAVTTITPADRIPSPTRS